MWCALSLVLLPGWRAGSNFKFLPCPGVGRGRAIYFATMISKLRARKSTCAERVNYPPTLARFHFHAAQFRKCALSRSFFVTHVYRHAAFVLLSVTPRCARCRQVAEQKRASARLPLNFTPHPSQIVGGFHWLRRCLRRAYCSRRLALSCSFFFCWRKSHSALHLEQKYTGFVLAHSEQG
jgi:hypothetical protein